MEKENKKAATADNLQKELNDWKNALSSETPRAAAKKITNADRIKDELNNWQGKFPSQSADTVLKELNDLRSKPTDVNPSAEQQQKITDLIKVIEKQNQTIGKLNDSIDGMGGGSDLLGQIVDISKWNIK